MMLRCHVFMSLAITMATAFQTTTMKSTFCRLAPLQEAKGEEKQEEQEETSNVEKFLSVKYPSFYSLLQKNDNVWKDNSSGCTYFAPNAKAFEDLGDKKLQQLDDPRNLEVAQKIGLYHIIGTEAVTYQRLCTEDWTGPKPADGSPRPFSVGGVVTLGGEVPVGRSKSGGFLGIGAKEDGGAVVGPDAKIVQSYEVGDCIVHEVDAFISPIVLWRYCDQLRIPGF